MSDAIRRMGYTVNRMLLTESDKRFHYQGKKVRITQIERMRVEIPYLEQVRPHLQRGWNLGNRATDEDFQANESEYLRQWHLSEPPIVRTSIYLVHIDEGLVGVGEGADIPSRN